MKPVIKENKMTFRSEETRNLFFKCLRMRYGKEVNGILFKGSFNCSVPYICFLRFHECNKTIYYKVTCKVYNKNDFLENVSLLFNKDFSTFLEVF